MASDADSATEAAVIEAEEERCQVIADEDWDALDRILGADYTYTHSNGKLENKADWMAGIRNRPRKIVRENLVVRSFDDIALLSGRLLMTVTPHDAPQLEVDLDVLQVWQWRDGAWRLIAHHGVRNQPPAA
jgi:ketosteroid isomerase-like protein